MPSGALAWKGSTKTTKELGVCGNAHPPASEALTLMAPLARRSWSFAPPLLEFCPPPRVFAAGGLLLFPPSPSLVSSANSWVLLRTNMAF